MKHFLTISFILLFLNQMVAQFFPLQFISDVPYVNNKSDHTQLIAFDSSVYAIRSGGLEILNTTDEEMNYRWANHYSLKTLLLDSGGKYVFLKDNKYIGRYNFVSQKYENIADASFQSISFVSQIGISPDFRIWVIAGYNKLGIFNGTSWQWTSFSFGSNFNDLIVANDSMAYITDSNREIYRLHNGILDSIYSYTNYSAIQDLMTDGVGNLWVAMKDSLLSIQGNSVFVYDTSDIHIGNDKFYHLAKGANGRLWLSGSNSKIYEFDGINWTTHLLPQSLPIKNFTIDNHNNVNVVSGYSSYSGVDSLYIWNGINWSSHSYLFNPYKNISAINDAYIATEEGIFEFNGNSYPPLLVYNFYDSVSRFYANDVTCFSVTDDYNPTYGIYGTHHGVYGLTINNALLPDTNINYIYTKNGSYYIGTNKGLSLYNQLIYVNFDTSNSPLPSNKITYVTSDQYSRLYIGTDEGVAIYSNGQWQVFDTSNVTVNSFNVTCILPPNYGDTSIWVTTMGSGLIRLNFNGTYKLSNTLNGEIEDDSLYYVRDIFLAKCGEFRAIGTKHNGIAQTNGWMNTFDYVRCYNNCYNTDSLYESNLIASSYYGRVYIVTNAGIFWGDPCGAVEEVTSNGQQLKWFEENNQVSIFVPVDFNGKGQLVLSDLLGRSLITGEVTLQESQTVSFDTGRIPKGFYLLELSTKERRVVTKVVLK